MREKMWWDLLQPLISERSSFTTKEAAACWNVSTSTARSRLHAIRTAGIAEVIKCRMMLLPLGPHPIAAWSAWPLPTKRPRP